MKLGIKTNINLFKKVMTFIGKLSTETNIKMEEDGVTIIGNACNSALAHVKFDKEFFDEYEGTAEIGIMLADITKVVNKFKEVTITDQSGRLELKSEKGKAYIPILADIDCVDTLPKVDLDFSTDVPLSELKEGVEMLAVTGGDKVRFLTKDGNLMIECTNVNREMTFRLKEGITGPEVDVSFGLMYLQPLLETIFDNLTVELKTDMPMVIKAETKGVHLTYFIASRIDG